MASVGIRGGLAYLELDDEKRPAVLDGGLATFLDACGAACEEHELWSARHLTSEEGLGAVRKAHEAYYKAGAHVATTATYQASFSGFKAHGYTAAATKEAMAAGIKAAKAARENVLQERMGMGATSSSGGLLVAGSLGAYGAHKADGSEYNGSYAITMGGDVGQEEMAAFHGARAECLRDAGCDVLAFETIPVAAEAEAIAMALDETVQHPAWISFSCASASTLCSGEAFAKGARAALASPHVVGVGINCVRPEHCQKLLAIARAEVERAGAKVVLSEDDDGKSRVVRLLVYPNSGEEWDAERRAWVVARKAEGEKDSFERDGKGGRGAAAAAAGLPGDNASAGKSLVDMVPDWIAEGATFIGGCCRVGPEDIAHIARKVGW